VTAPGPPALDPGADPTAGSPDVASEAIPDALAADLASTSLALARRFAAGATMWCLSPRWPHHARHVAVEFVHPVIVGKRALPALLVAGDDPVGQLRIAVRPGDIVLAVAPGDDPQVADALRRCDAWGTEGVWIGTGPRPRSGAAAHVLWLDERPEFAPYDGRFLLLYHVLWELTSVCFDHPGLLRPADPCTDEVCITCSDEGRLAEVVAADPTSAAVLAGGKVETIDTTLVGPLTYGNLVLVHAGSAIRRLDAQADR
jgi:hydrogenase maturation factor